MKLNNHGWGMKEMIIYLCIFSVILIFVAISINSLYKRVNNDLAESKNNPTVSTAPADKDDSQNGENIVDDTNETKVVNYEYYTELEQKVYNATEKYLSDYPTEVGNSILKVEVTSLVNLGYLSELKDDDGTGVCNGYSNVYAAENSTDYTIKSYVTCDNYMTDGY